MYLTNFTHFYVWLVFMALAVITYLIPMAVNLFKTLTDEGNEENSYDQDDDAIIVNRCYHAAILFFTIALSGFIGAIARSFINEKYFVSLMSFLAILPFTYLLALFFYLLIFILINKVVNKKSEPVLNTVNAKSVIIAFSILLICIDVMNGKFF